MLFAALILSGIALPIYQDPTRPIPERIQDLMDNMTLEEKVGQLVEIGPYGDWHKDFLNQHVGSMLYCLNEKAAEAIQLVNQTRLKIPVLLAIDAELGHKTVQGCTFFGLPLNAAQSWDEELIEMMGNITAYEMRYSGPAWTFAPIMCIARDLRWGRVGETFGEDPYLLGRLGAAIVRGFQGPNGITSNPDKVLSCAKHYAGYSETMGGRDASESENSERKLRSFFLPTFEAVIKNAKIGSLMIAYEGLDGTPCCINEWLLRQVLRKEWGFEGLTITDSGDISQLVSQGVAENMEESAAMSIAAGTDMSMTNAKFYTATLNAVHSGKLDVKYIDEAVRRQLNIKFTLGLFENPRLPDPVKLQERLSSDFSRAQAQKLDEESIVLLKNDGILPYTREHIMKFVVVGPNADDDVQQNAGQHQPRNKTITILDGIRKFFWNVEYEKGCGIVPGETADLDAAILAINASDAAVVVIGDRSAYYWESHSVATLELQGGQKKMLDAIVATKKKFTLVVLSAKPLVIPENVRNAASAIIWQFCPGNMGGRALARVLNGQVNPSGRLTVSIPSHVGQQPCYYYQNSYQHGGYADWENDPVWAFGYGLGYSQVDYVDARLDKSTYKIDEDIHVSVKVKNSGMWAADEVVQVYIGDLVTSVTWGRHQLKGFKRVSIVNGTEVDVHIVIPVRDCWIINKKAEKVVEPGAFEARIGKASNDIKVKRAFTVLA
jgi:beta-glucosidase